MTRHYQDLGSPSDWIRQIFNQSEPPPRSGSTLTSHQYKINYLCTHSSNIILQGNQWCHVGCFLRLKLIGFLLRIRLKKPISDFVVYAFTSIILILNFTIGLLTSFSNPVMSTLCLEAFLRLLSTSSSSNFFLFMERDELRRGVPRPCLEIGAPGFVVRPDGRGTGTGGLGRVVGGKEVIVCLSVLTKF